MLKFNLFWSFFGNIRLNIWTNQCFDINLLSTTTNKLTILNIRTMENAITTKVNGLNTILTENKMVIVATAPYKKVTFVWNEQLTECNFQACGVSDQEIEILIKNKVHEGCDFEEWTTEIN